MLLKTCLWNPADYLDSDEMILAYLEAAFEDGHPAVIAAAFSNVARARGVADPAPTGTAGIDRLVGTVKSLRLELTAKAASVTSESMRAYDRDVLPQADAVAG